MAYRLRYLVDRIAFKRQESAIRGLLSKHSRFDPNLSILRSGRKAALFKLEAEFSLNSIRLRSLSTISGIAQTNNLLHWTLPSKTNGPVILNLLSDDREKFVRILQSTEGLSHWYVSPVDNSGKMLKGVSFLADFSDNYHFSAIRVFERVACSEALSFRSGALQGVEIRFWDEVPDSETSPSMLSCPVWHEEVAELPNCRTDPEDFWRQVGNLCNEHVGSFHEKIDIVYTWVDGSDKNWLMKKNASAISANRQDLVAESHDDARFRDNDELRFSLRSIYQYAPWVNKIYVVTDSQTPAWLRTDGRLEVVDHKDIWPDDIGLPSFNSHAIESCIHRIPGLSEHFLYFNDDVLLTRPVCPDLFFFASGVSKIFWSKAQVNSLPPDAHEGASTTAAKNARAVLVRNGYKNFSRKFFHTPGVLRRSVCESLELEFSQEYAATRAAQFRSSNDLATAGSFYFNFALSTGIGVPSKIKYDYIDPSTIDGRMRMLRLLRRRNYDCVVINDRASASPDIPENASADFIKSHLRRFLPIPCPWEISK